MTDDPGAARLQAIKKYRAFDYYADGSIVNEHMLYVAQDVEPLLAALVSLEARCQQLEQLVQELYAVHPAWVPPELDTRVATALADALREAPPQTEEEMQKTVARGETRDYSEVSSPPQRPTGR